MVRGYISTSVSLSTLAGFVRDIVDTIVDQTIIVKGEIDTIITFDVRFFGEAYTLNCITIDKTAEHIKLFPGEDQIIQLTIPSNGEYEENLIKRILRRAGAGFLKTESSDEFKLITPYPRTLRASLSEGGL